MLFHKMTHKIIPDNSTLVWLVSAGGSTSRSWSRVSGEVEHGAEKTMDGGQRAEMVPRKDEFATSRDDRQLKYSAKTHLMNCSCDIIGECHTQCSHVISELNTTQIAPHTSGSVRPVAYVRKQFLTYGYVRERSLAHTHNPFVRNCFRTYATGRTLPPVHGQNRPGMNYTTKNCKKLPFTL